MQHARVHVHLPRCMYVHNYIIFQGTYKLKILGGRVPPVLYSTLREVMIDTTDHYKKIVGT